MNCSPRSSKYFVFVLAAFALGACATQEEQIQYDAGHMFSGEQGDFATLCGRVGEYILENGDFTENNANIKAHIARSSIVSRTAQKVVATVDLDGFAANHYKLDVTVDCTFDPTRSVADRWYELTAMTFAGRKVSDEVVNNLNNLGVSLAMIDAGETKPAAGEDI